MQAMKQSDVPTKDSLVPLPEELTYAATLDIRDIEGEITDFMIRRACEEMDEYQQYPFCAAGKSSRNRA